MLLEKEKLGHYISALEHLNQGGTIQVYQPNSSWVVWEDFSPPDYHQFTDFRPAPLKQSYRIALFKSRPASKRLKIAETAQQEHLLSQSADFIRWIGPPEEVLLGVDE